MKRRGLLAVAAALVVASGCSSNDNDDAEPANSAPVPVSPATSDGAREAVEAYVRALNARSAKALIEVGGVKDEEWSRKEAAQILANRGGRDWKIMDLQIDHDMGPDNGSARLVAEDKTGKSLKDTFTVTREKSTWHLVVFTHQSPEPGKDPAATDKSPS
ncbi:hypothetical protein ABZ079_33285 [Streptomyces sp. NPDC006314]|uniref:hypothetical protein n=1 Tax=Streptomyces sp. NPDC006314 TaxID=3154475 RepID=UPI0033A061E1